MESFTEKIVTFLKVLADVTRLDIIDFLKKGEKTSIDIQNTLNKSQSTISQHLKTLYESKLITFRRDGNKKIYRINDDEIFKILMTVKSFVSKLQKLKLEELTSFDILDILQ
ncbi:MAG: ArsR/SmtB family transcription factor [Promethearchaeota archaeon]